MTVEHHQLCPHQTEKLLMTTAERCPALDPMYMAIFGLPFHLVNVDTPALPVPPPSPPTVQPKKKKKKKKKKTNNTKKLLRHQKYAPPKYKPDLFKDTPCCEAGSCSVYFTQKQVDGWRKLRERVDLNVRDMKDRALQTWESMLVPSGVKCCVKFFKWVFGFNNNTIYYQRQGRLIAGRRDGSRVDTSVMGWFLNLKEMLDCMPDQDVYQIAAPWKRDVHRWSSALFVSFFVFVIFVM